MQTRKPKKKSAMQIAAEAIRKAKVRVAKAIQDSKAGKQWE